MESFRNRYNENEFNCTINKISSGYVYIVKPKSKIEKNQSNHSQIANSKKATSSILIEPLSNKKPASRVNSLATEDLEKVKKALIKAENGSIKDFIEFVDKRKKYEILYL